MAQNAAKLFNFYLLAAKTRIQPGGQGSLPQPSRRTCRTPQQGFFIGPQGLIANEITTGYHGATAELP
jgi:hypothetical protein